MTIPRLELSAAVMLAKLTLHCIKTLNLSTVPCYLWTDSSIVHIWINNHPSRWKDFIHNKVYSIQTILPNAQWKHVPGTQNPADCASRGLSATELQNHSLWWNGPPWLLEHPSTWPNITSKKVHSNRELEERISTNPIVLHATTSSNSSEIINKFSSLQQLLRFTATCKRVAKYCQKKFQGSLNSPLTPEELHTATYHWILIIQRQSFSSELTQLKNSKDLSKSNFIIRLLPFIDQQGLLRVGGRLKNSFLPADSKHPFILPKDSPLTELIIRDAHQKTLHGSTQETLLFIRQTYWIIGGRAPVRSHILICITCTRYRRSQARHLMGQLPTRRVTPSRAFLHTGLDYAGPYSPTCWKGRAIHLEIVTDYTADAFIAAYRRFTSRRGICSTLTSDCSTNFIGADKELRKLFSQSSKELNILASTIAHDGTKWIFNPPATPHFGGKWEAGLKSMKYHLKRVVGDTLLTYERMSTLLCQIEAILNSRPLCNLTDDPADLNVLTPGHFLIGHSLNLIPEPGLQHLKTSRLSHWQHICQMTQSFWDKWSKEYLQRYFSIYKWNRSSTPLNEGSLVLITDERYPPAKWPLGRIIKLHHGSDGIARVAEIKTSSTTITRPLVKLCPLNIDTSKLVYLTSPKVNLCSRSTQPLEFCSLLESTKAGGNV